jgi:hypothetical protein
MEQRDCHWEDFREISDLGFFFTKICQQIPISVPVGRKKKLTRQLT